MGHVRYTLNEYLDSPAAERLLYVSSTTYEKDWISLNHTHSFVELFYVVDGRGHLCIDNEDIPIRKDHAIIINPNTMHTEKSSVKNPLSYIVLGIDNLNLQIQNGESEQGKGVNYSLYDFTAQRNVFLPILKIMLHELKKRESFYESVCQHYLNILILNLERITGDSLTPFSARDIPVECEQMKIYIDAHYQDTISLNTLAERVNLNKYYLAHLFSATYGISPINYLLERRLLHGKDLLKTSSYSITQIAQVTGFSSANYFSQAFKKGTGMTPRQYRKSHKKGPADE